MGVTRLGVPGCSQLFLAIQGQVAICRRRIRGA